MKVVHSKVMTCVTDTVGDEVAGGAAPEVEAELGPEKCVAASVTCDDKKSGVGSLSNRSDKKKSDGIAAQCSEIIPGLLYLSGREAVLTRPEIIKRYNIGAVISIRDPKRRESRVAKRGTLVPETKEVRGHEGPGSATQLVEPREDLGLPSHVAHHEYLFWDTSSAKLSVHFESAYKVMCDAMTGNYALLVHCRRGVSRSPALAVALMMMSIANGRIALSKKSTRAAQYDMSTYASGMAPLSLVDTLILFITRRRPINIIPSFRKQLLAHENNLVGKYREARTTY